MAAFSNVAIIYNPNSTGNAEANARQLQADLGGHLPDVPVELLPTARAGHADELAYNFARTHDKPLIIAASGDGGYHEVINGALRAQIEGSAPICAVLPSGNANDHARTMQSAPLLDLIRAGGISRLDVLEVAIRAADGRETSRFAHSYVGLGLTPTVAVELNKHTLNSLKEAWIVLRTFWSLRPVTILSGGRRRRLDSLICSTIPEMAKVLTISDESAPDDGLFELTTFEHNRKLKLVIRLVKGLFTLLGARSRVHDYECTVVSPAPMQLDGEVIELGPNTGLRVSVRSGLLHTFV